MDAPLGGAAAPSHSTEGAGWQPLAVHRTRRTYRRGTGVGPARPYDRVRDLLFDHVHVDDAW